MKKKTKVQIINKSRRLLLETDLNEKEIAELLCISEVFLRKLYKCHFGYPPRTYIRKVKLKKAKTMIRITDYSITKIAEEIGYTNISKFSYAFKVEFGYLPSEYRAKIK
ncbi:MAG: helix-turn-helix domain-containing protein [Lachnospirales bacterium]